jgi:hypothetical protein
MTKIIKISLVLSGEEDAFEFHRALPESYFNGCHIDLFTDEIESLRAEVRAQRPELEGYEEAIRIAAMDSDTGEVIPKSTG